MNPNLAKSALLLGGVVAASLVAVAGLAAGCGGGSSGGPPSEAGLPDNTTDTAIDVPTVDVAPDTEGPDTGMEPDAADSGVGDAIADVQYDVPEVSNFPRQVTEAFCRRLQFCCNADSGTFNVDGDGGCVTQLEAPGVGGFWNLSGFNSALGTRNIQYDQASASACLSAVSAFSCGLVPSTVVDQTVTTCYAALRGIQDGGAPCDNSLECVPGTYCSVPVGATTGTCAALRMIGQSCLDPQNSTDCSYRGTGSPTAYCNSIDGGPGVCATTLGADAGCALDPQCQSNVCNNPTCSNQYVFSDFGTPGGICTFFP